MELYLPEYGFFIWTFLSFINLLGVVFSLISLFKNYSGSRYLLSWFLFIIFIPLVGFIVYIIKRKKNRSYISL
jgi:hypothetical protein